MRRLAAIVWVIAAGVMTVPALGDGAGVKIHVEAEDRTYFVGEPLVLRVGVENTGAEPVKFSVVRDGARVTNLAMTATDEAGKRVGVINSTLGGSVSEVEIGPGDMVWVRAELFDHVVFIKAGTYRLRVAVNLRDESEDAAKEPSGEVTLKIAMPTETDAAAVLKRIATAGAAGEGGVYRDPPPLGVAHDMGSLGSPVYLPGLLRLVANGDTEAVRGVGSIDTPEATRALVKLLESTSSEVRDAAAWEMMDRLPVSKEEEVLVDAGERALRTRVSKADWREEFREPVRAAALDRATGPDAYPAGAGWLLCTVGKAEDFGVMLQALEEEVRSGKEQGAIADEMVLTAAEVLVRRGAAVPREGSSVAGELVFVRHLRVDGGYRPAGWEARLEKATKADFAGLRKEAAGALGGMAGELEPGMAAALVAQLGDTREEVREAAMRAAGLRKLSAAREPVLKIIGGTSSEEELSCALDAMEELGHRAEGLEAAVARLEDPVLSMGVQEKLLGLFAADGWVCHGQIDPGALAKAETSWREYLRAHAAEIDAGKKLDATQASVDMFPGGNYVHLMAGGTYPPGRGK